MQEVNQRTGGIPVVNDTNTTAFAFATSSFAPPKLPNPARVWNQVSLLSRLDRRPKPGTLSLP